MGAPEQCDPFAAQDDPFADPAGVRQSGQYGATPKPVFGLPARAVRLYGWLSARYGGFRRGIFPAHKTLAAELGWTRRTVLRAVRDLEDAGWLEVTARPGTSSRYRLVADAKEAARVAKMRKKMRNRRSAPGGVSGESRPGAARSSAEARNRRSAPGGVTGESQGGVTGESHQEPANYVGVNQLQRSFYERTKKAPDPGFAALSAGSAPSEGPQDEYPADDTGQAGPALDTPREGRDSAVTPPPPEAGPESPSPAAEAAEAAGPQAPPQRRSWWSRWDEPKTAGEVEDLADELLGLRPPAPQPSLREWARELLGGPEDGPGVLATATHCLDEPDPDLLDLLEVPGASYWQDELDWPGQAAAGEVHTS